MWWLSLLFLGGEKLQESRGFKRKIKHLEELNLELEHEWEKLMGLGQSNAALGEHTSIFETALAKREADLVQLNLQVQAVLQRKEEEDQQIKQLVQSLQTALEKEKAKVRSLKEQKMHLNRLLGLPLASLCHRWLQPRPVLLDKTAVISELRSCS
ncbi:golgin subfamily A member 3-like [Notamacropus eugenii]|uniref:golgin subfamily A member 3-like n=1 Tax=Notamacropus eugenii TaxID=9315 RepID=UPI003B66E1B4